MSSKKRLIFLRAALHRRPLRGYVLLRPSHRSTAPGRRILSKTKFSPKPLTFYIS